MVSKLTAFVRELREYDPSYKLEGCIQVLDEGLGGAKASLAKLGRISTIGDDELVPGDPDLRYVWNWLGSLITNFPECWDHGLKFTMDDVRSASAAYSLYAASAILFKPRPNWTPASPDGT
ncbi:hypothetical protein BAE44_0003930 [Dichanthelium oligosanthes]|uniref:Uncharacterized protein n=1 Tax=Dichanthelium oligosanthes TaxID=888268 RepID=A0A1E5WCF4_9POAL|nr:hypothetical protein BAE44_0003930 [Dichanthelium oligosanthes]